MLKRSSWLNNIISIIIISSIIIIINPLFTCSFSCRLQSVRYTMFSVCLAGQVHVKFFIGSLYSGQINTQNKTFVSFWDVCRLLVSLPSV